MSELASQIVPEEVEDKPKSPKAIKRKKIRKTAQYHDDATLEMNKKRFNTKRGLEDSKVSTSSSKKRIVVHVDDVALGLGLNSTVSSNVRDLSQQLHIF